MLTSITVYLFREIMADTNNKGMEIAVLMTMTSAFTDIGILALIIKAII